MTDFSSERYWTPRLRAELASGGFEWLVPDRAAADFVLRVIDAWRQGRELSRPIQILHLGAGSSNLGPLLAAELETRGLCGNLVDADYADLPARDTASASGAQTAGTASRDASRPAFTVERRRMNVLDFGDDGERWDIIVDKSTADAISCGPDIVSAGDVDQHVRPPMQVLVDNLARVTHPGAVWACISYSDTRFDFLPAREMGIPQGGKGAEQGAHEWHVANCSLLARVSGEPRMAGDRVVYEPETGVWGWTLSKT